MKKYSVAVAISMVGLMALVAFAGAVKEAFEPEATYEGPVSGFAIVNETPGDAISDDGVETTVQVQIRGADPNLTYEVISGGDSLGFLKVNKNGSGHLHVNLEGDLPGARVNIFEDGTRILRTPVLAL